MVNSKAVEQFINEQVPYFFGTTFISDNYLNKLKTYRNIHLTEGEVSHMRLVQASYLTRLLCGRVSDLFEKEQYERFIDSVRVNMKIWIY